MKRRGFTLVEMLVVIGIVVVLLGLLAPMVVRAWRAGDRAKTWADLNAIAMALEAYRQDHGDYPRVAGKPFQNANAADSTYNGARMLCRALIGPGPGIAEKPTDYFKVADGAGISLTPGTPETEPGPGFRLRGTQGKVYGPYLKVDQFKLINPTATPTSPFSPGLLTIGDNYGRPILYYPGLGKPNTRQADGYIRDYDNDAPGLLRPLYNGRDNTGAIPGAMFAKLMGDTNANGRIDGSEKVAYEGAYVLWSSGPDETFGIASGLLEKTDDVTNFRK